MNMMIRKLLEILPILLVGSQAFANAPQLKMLVWEGYAPKEYVEKFKGFIKEKYKQDVDIKVDFLSNPEEFFAAAKDKKYHLISPTHNLIKDERFKFIEQKLIIPIDKSFIKENYSHLIPFIKDANFNKEGDNLYSMPFVYGPYGLVYNFEKVKTAPTKWDDLWNPAFKNKFTVAEDYPEVNVYISLLAMGVSIDAITVEQLSKKDVEEKILQLAKNARNFWKGVDTADALMENEIAAVWGFSLPDLEKKGKKWLYTTPKEGIPGWVDNYCITAAVNDDEFLKKVAMEWVNFIITPNFQKDVVIGSLGSFPVSTAVASLLEKSEISRTHLDDMEYFKKNFVMWPTVSKRVRNKMVELWNKGIASRK